MKKVLSENIQIFLFKVLMYLTKNVCPTILVVGKLRSGRTLSVAEGRKPLFIASLVEVLTGNDVLDPVIEKSLDLARLRASGVNDEKLIQLITEFVTEK